MRNYTVGRIWDIPIRINISLILFLPILVWLIGSGEQIGFYADVVGGLAGTELDTATLMEFRWVIGVVAAVGLFVSVLLHELGHSWAAMRYDIGIESITLWIFGGVAALQRVPKEWDREFWIALAGPVTSVGIGIVCLAALWAIPSGLPILIFAVGWLGVVNIVLAIFNMIPAFPMDGGRILRALLARRRPYASATRIAARIGVMFAWVFVIVGVLAFNIILILIALFIYMAATGESRYTVVADLLDGLTAGELASREPGTVSADTTLGAFADQMFESRRTAFPVADDDGEIIGYVTLGHLKRAKKADAQTTTVREIMTESPVRVDVADPAFDALVAINTARAEYALVEEEGAVVGLLSMGEFTEALEFASVAGKRAEPAQGGVV